MNSIKILLSAFLFCTFDCLAAEAQFGIASSQDGILCVSFGDAPPPMGSHISIVEARSPQYFFEGKLGAESNICNALEMADIVGPYFIVTTEKKFANSFMGIAVLSKNAISVVKSKVELNTATSGTKIFFRSCTTNEGLYFSTWRGLPLKGKRIWQAYYYLGYDVIPSCQEDDFKK